MATVGRPTLGSSRTALPSSLPSPSARASARTRSPSFAEKLLFGILVAVALLDVALFLAAERDPTSRDSLSPPRPDMRRVTGGGSGTYAVEPGKGGGVGNSDDVAKAAAAVATVVSSVGVLGRNGTAASGTTNATGDGRLHELLVRSGVKVDAGVDSDLPSWSDLESMYSVDEGPIIVGLDLCKEFRASVPRDERYVGPAGMFNTGTNLLAELLGQNCRIDRSGEAGRGHDNHGMRWQVPWGKHTPASWRGVNVAYSDRKRGIFIDPDLVLPVVIVKDPYGWMGSMCRHGYAASWRHRKEHCPNLIPDEEDRRRGIKGDGPDGSVGVTVRFNPQNVTRHSSLAGLWKDWYRAYHSASGFPRLVVRYEDILVHPERVVEEVCHCAGGITSAEEGREFHYMGSSAKGDRGPHTGSSGLLTALRRYGSPAKRVEGLTAEDLEYAERALGGDLMEAYKYSFPPLQS